jgi:PPOX class probable FMN-dependent enzyme
MATTVATGADTFQQIVTSKEDLRDIMGHPNERAVKKQQSALDAHCRNFIARSPFLLLATTSASGACDVSPKGDAPGFVTVLDDKTIAIPDRRGNKRLDGLTNILDNPHAGTIFLIPGVGETLRVNGTARIVQDEWLLEQMAVQGSRPQVAIVISVEECFLHCPKAFLRSDLWNPKHFAEKGDLPTIARVVTDQIRPPGMSDEEHQRLIAEAEAALVESCKLLY